MIPGKMFTGFAKFQGIVSVHDFWFPLGFQELLQALSCVEELFSTRVSRSSAEVRRVFIHDIKEVEVVRQQEQQGDMMRKEMK